MKFEFYFNVFRRGTSGVIPPTEFERYVMLAEKALEGYVMHETIPEDSETVKLCLCEVAELLFRSEKNGCVKSESVDGYSVTFSDKKSADEEVRRIILQRLGKSGLLYAGVE